MVSKDYFCTNYVATISHMLRFNFYFSYKNEIVESGKNFLKIIDFTNHCYK